MYLRNLGCGLTLRVSGLGVFGNVKHGTSVQLTRQLGLLRRLDDQAVAASDGNGQRPWKPDSEKL